MNKVFLKTFFCESYEASSKKKVFLEPLKFKLRNRNEPIFKDNMKKLALSFLASSLIAGVAIAGGCDYHQEVTMASNKPVLMFQLNDMKLMKYTSSNGTTLFIIQNIEGETVAKDLDQNQLASRYPEMAEKLEG